MYNRIRQHPAVLDIYSKQLANDGVVEASHTEELRQAAASELEKKQKQAVTYVPEPGEWAMHSADNPVGVSNDGTLPTTGVDDAILCDLARSITRLPPELAPHRVVNALYKQRSKMVDDREIDWALAEQLAWASCLVSGVHVRLSGQDVERGTFSHRHAVIHDQKRFGERYVPLQHLSPTQAPFEICNSSLSEFAVLGFELGCSLERIPSLIMWEAQFGDFANTAQCVIDQFIAAGESKWNTPSALVMLLPHGLEGSGPEHSSARLERFLQMCDDDEREVVSRDAQIRSANWQVVNVTTPANFFHVLRRQVCARVCACVCVCVYVCVSTCMCARAQACAADVVPSHPLYRKQTRLLLRSWTGSAPIPKATCGHVAKAATSTQARAFAARRVPSWAALQARTAR